MAEEGTATRILLMGIGNVLLSDDGVGVHVIRALDEQERAGTIHRPVALRDGGTIGLELFNEFENLAALIVIDAAEMGAMPGTVRTFKGPDMDAQLLGKKRTAHEVALADLVMTAKLTGCLPRRRALVAVQPGSIEWGLSPTAPVRAAVPRACAIVLALLEDWEGVHGSDIRSEESVHV